MKKILLLVLMLAYLASCSPHYTSPMVKAWTPKDHSKDYFKKPRKHQKRH